jgi:hypothetical protein
MRGLPSTPDGEEHFNKEFGRDDIEFQEPVPRAETGAQGVDEDDQGTIASVRTTEANARILAEKKPYLITRIEPPISGLDIEGLKRRKSEYYRSREFLSANFLSN